MSSLCTIKTLAGTIQVEANSTTAEVIQNQYGAAGVRNYESGILVSGTLPAGNFILQNVGPTSIPSFNSLLPAEDNFRAYPVFAPRMYGRNTMLERLGRVTLDDGSKSVTVFHDDNVFNSLSSLQAQLLELQEHSRQQEEHSRRQLLELQIH